VALRYRLNDDCWTDAVRGKLKGHSRITLCIAALFDGRCAQIVQSRRPCPFVTFFNTLPIITVCRIYWFISLQISLQDLGSVPDSIRQEFMRIIRQSMEREVQQ
jgi:hypothetical protein